VRSLVPKLLAPVAVLVALLAMAASAVAAPTFAGKFTIPGAISANNKIVAGPDGNVWMTVSTVGKDVAKIAPNGSITEFDLPGVEGTNGIAVGPEGNLWVPTVEKVSSFSPGDPVGTTQTFAVPSIAAEGQIVADGNEMWVASNNDITHFAAADPKGTAKFFEPKGELGPKDIDIAGPLVVIADSGHERLVTVNATSGKQGADIPLGDKTTTSQGLAAGSGGQVGFSKSDGTEGLGLVTPPAAPTAALMPGDPFGVALGSDGAYWIAMSAAHGVERLTPAGVATALPFTGLEKWFPRQIAAGPGNTLWVTMEVPGENEYAVGLVTGLEPPVPPVPKTNPTPLPITPVLSQAKIGKGPKGAVKTTKPKATVKFTFSASIAGSTFQCSLIRGTKTKKGKLHFAKARFTGCKSPKSYRVSPGSYRFEVRALGAGGTDSAPAKRSFRVVRTHR
jgi:streptogramin lyase